MGASADIVNRRMGGQVSYFTSPIISHSKFYV